jgi:hypothetical protein
MQYIDRSLLIAYTTSIFHVYGPKDKLLALKRSGPRMCLLFNAKRRTAGRCSKEICSLSGYELNIFFIKSSTATEYYVNKEENDHIDLEHNYY